MYIYIYLKIRFRRHEKKFSGFEKLLKAIKTDIKIAEKVLETSYFNEIRWKKILTHNEKKNVKEEAEEKEETISLSQNKDHNNSDKSRCNNHDNDNQNIMEWIPT